jgi:hypothetical protein
MDMVIQYITTSLGNPLSLTTSRVVAQKDYNRADGLSGNTGLRSFWYFERRQPDLNLPTYLYRYYAMGPDD